MSNGLLLYVFGGINSQTASFALSGRSRPIIYIVLTDSINYLLIEQNYKVKLRRGSQAVRQESAKLLYSGSIPLRASNSAEGGIDPEKATKRSFRRTFNVDRRGII